MTAEEVKTMREEVERRYNEQNIKEMCELYKDIKDCLSVSDYNVKNNILDYSCWNRILDILSLIEKHPERKEVFRAEIDRLDSNRKYFANRHKELYMTEKEHKLPWWKRLFRKDTNPNSTNNKEN